MSGGADCVLRREVWVPRAIEEVFEFFSDARNLQMLTPDWVRLEILTTGEIEMAPGALIDYRIRIHGIPVRWRTEITVWNPPHEFVDQQLSGPYRLWHHTHRFFSEGGGTRCEDVVRYMPIGGRLVDRLFVRKDVERIFDYRSKKIAEMFGVPEKEGQAC